MRTMHFTAYRQLPDEEGDDPGARFVAFGEDPVLQNVHRVTAEGLEQMAAFFPAVTKWGEWGSSHVLEAVGELTLEEIVERWGKVTPLTGERLFIVEEVLRENEVREGGRGSTALAGAQGAGRAEAGGGQANGVRMTRMFYTRFNDGERELVAFGNWGHWQNVHRLEDGKMVQTPLIYPQEWERGSFGEPEVAERGEATLEELVDRYGPVEPLPEPALSAFKEEERQREAAAERLSAPVEFVRVPDEVLAIPAMTQAEVEAKIREVAARVAELSEEDRGRYERYRDVTLIGHPSPSQKRWLDAALMALNDVRVRPA